MGLRWEKSNCDEFLPCNTLLPLLSSLIILFLSSFSCFWKRFVLADMPDMSESTDSDSDEGSCDLDAACSLVTIELAPSCIALHSTLLRSESLSDAIASLSWSFSEFQPSVTFWVLFFSFCFLSAFRFLVVCFLLCFGIADVMHFCKRSSSESRLTELDEPFSSY
ncbi:hypothetical protein ANANG_G00087320 [Anguilla anguilla]|uniref:Uncharacterized protein n=1 Tax=Anguilla anguilla TaxID=7936 RepID=A0A9D3S1A8_ANGAN|nr:hypothetical protein ANANG_G00087320 [Anguilla anguilla]